MKKVSAKIYTASFFYLSVLAGSCLSAEINANLKSAEQALSNLSLAANVQRPLTNDQLSLISDKRKIEWGGLGENCERNPKVLSQISHPSPADTISIGIDPKSDCFLLGNLFNGKEFHQRYPNFLEMFRGKIENILIGHVGDFLFEENQVYEKLSQTDAEHKLNKNKAMEDLAQSVAMDFKWQMDLLAPKGTFTYQTYVMPLVDMIEDFGIPQTLFPTPEKMVFSHSTKVTAQKNLFTNEDNLLLETPFSMTDKVNESDLFILYYKIFSQLGLHEITIDLIFVDAEKDHKNEEQIRAILSGKPSESGSLYLQVSGKKPA